MNAPAPLPPCRKSLSKMEAKEQDLISNIVSQISEAFTLEDGTDMEPIRQLAENIIVTIKTSLPKVAAVAKPAAAKTKPSTKASKSGSDGKRKGNAYSHFVSVVAAQARGEAEHADKVVTVTKRDKVPDASAKNISEHAEFITYDSEISFAEFYDMVNGFETQPMKRSAIMWSLLSDEDRLQFAAE